MGLNSRSFLDRRKLGAQAKSAGDLIGAIVEYRAALNLKPDQQLRDELRTILVRLRNENSLLSGLGSDKQGRLETIYGRQGQAKAKIVNP